MSENTAKGTHHERDCSAMHATGYSGSRCGQCVDASVSYVLCPMCDSHSAGLSLGVFEPTRTPNQLITRWSREGTGGLGGKPPIHGI